MSRNPFAKEQNEQSTDPPPAAGWAQSANDKPWGAGALEESQPDPAAPRAHIASIPAADWQPKERQKDTRKREKSHWLPLLKQNKQGVVQHAGALNVPEYELVRYLLENGLGQVADGSLVFEAQLAETGLTLYPDEMRGRGHRKVPRDLVNTSYRGIPAETWSELKMLARDYPIWQVANKLIEHGLEQIACGQLAPRPQHTGIRTLY